MNAVRHAILTSKVYQSTSLLHTNIHLQNKEILEIYLLFKYE